MTKQTKQNQAGCTCQRSVCGCEGGGACSCGQSCQCVSKCGCTGGCSCASAPRK